MGHTVRIANIDRTIDVEEGQTILEAALAAGVNYPFGCHSGTCGTCKTALLSGTVRMLDYSKFAMTDAERAEGQILVCSAVPDADCEIRCRTGIFRYRYDHSLLSHPAAAAFLTSTIH